MPRPADFLPSFLAMLSLLGIPDPGAAQESSLPATGRVDGLIEWLLTEDEHLDQIPFSQVVAATAGVQVVPYDPESVTDRRIADGISDALDRLLAKLNQRDHPVHEVGRINEVSGHLEELLLDELNGITGFLCTRPLTAEGHLQRSGYPDLRLLDESSGRVFYLDPKLYAADSERSTFRTFYFEPKQETNKILEDATHLIVGIAHGGRVAGSWTFLQWSLVDLHRFEVRLKAEFQASNRDLYRAESIISTSEQ